MPDYAQLVGQEIPVRILRRAVQRGQLAHALLFHGEEGLGCEAAAWALARTLLCRAGGPEPCGECPGCRKVARLDHPDLQILLPLPAQSASNGAEEEDPAQAFSKPLLEAFQRWMEEPLRPPRPDFDKEAGARHRQIQVAQARHLKKWSSLRPFEGRHRVAILLEAERMGVQAQNALLKLLEEPPDQLVLLLCTSQPEALLPTIISRCQKLAFRPAPVETLASWLEARPEALAAGLDARQLAQQAGGNPGRALELASVDDEKDDLWDAAGFLRDALSSQVENLSRRVGEIDQKRDRESLRRLLGDLQTWLLDAELVRRLGDEARSRVQHADEYDDLERFSARVGLERPDVLLEGLAEAQRMVERNANTYTLLLTVAHLVRRECAAGRKRTA